MCTGHPAQHAPNQREMHATGYKVYNTVREIFTAHLRAQKKQERQLNLSDFENQEKLKYQEYDGST